MSTKLHSGLKRTLAWLLTAAMLAQGCFVVSADDFFKRAGGSAGNSGRYTV